MSMKTRLCLASLSVLLAAGAAARAAHLVEQTLVLQPGWNAIYLEVEPETNTCIDVFRDVPIASAWTWIPRGPTAEFVQDLSEELVRDPQWLCFFPTNRPERMFNNMFIVSANKPYFIKLEGTSAVNWVVSGRPAVASYLWQPNEFNLVGFPLKPTGPLPGIGSFFSHASALSNQSVFVLGANGRWEQAVNVNLPMQAGRCQWVYANAASTYGGPVAVTVESGDGLDYGKTLTELSVVIRNATASPTVIEVRDHAGPGPINYWTFNTGLGIAEWLPLPEPLVINLAGGASHTLRIAVDRDSFTQPTHETTIQVESDSGTRVRIPLTARLP